MNSAYAITKTQNNNIILRLGFFASPFPLLFLSFLLNQKKKKKNQEINVNGTTSSKTQYIFLFTLYRFLCFKNQEKKNQAVTNNISDVKEIEIQKTLSGTKVSNWLVWRNVHIAFILIHKFECST